MTKIERYNKAASAPKNKSKEIINIMNIKQGDKILEIGVGGGYYAKIFSEIVGEKGNYYGIDTDKTFIENLNVIGKSYLNIVGIKIQPNEIPDLQEKIDFVFTRNVYHHLENRTDYFRKISNMMTTKGKIIIIDYDESFSLFRFSGHYTKKALIIKELKEAGFSVIRDLKLLNKQSFLIFEKNENGV
ncbi:methyltransferase domain-containing protein [Pasteurella atlantica]|uniref:methyltransferase domain-containing protein n=1 Tax=Pasteurellaceae TaxID=712 RepID=UPI002755F89E|nr:methyltransferase domain-containing protein [Pasteurella atlantica]MDP8034402.1 methyltransferase domain-containing protein [Pasteurella atlantica]MDP8036333.1 methyltransferase domain-containing protein [Pasteurella atlantica]MDP8038286.1 methyltransferase domain-containing protein [Pasteurella atlantica]MDP8048654.1 methyltransferase domain-containing protein [Pasteurella atlantica]MDP8050594.1 methyltransferase domain-containing protein [Pasteurella atlantica]